MPTLPLLDATMQQVYAVHLDVFGRLLLPGVRVLGQYYRGGEPHEYQGKRLGKSGDRSLRRVSLQPCVAFL